MWFRVFLLGLKFSSCFPLSVLFINVGDGSKGITNRKSIPTCAVDRRDIASLPNRFNGICLIIAPSNA